jgi:hypothetical protein
VRELEQRNAALLVAWRARWEALDGDAPDPWPPIIRRLFERDLEGRRLAARQFLRSIARERARAARRQVRWYQVPYGQGWA